MIDTGANLETAVIATVGTAGATTVGAATDAGATVIPVASAIGFSAGQTITIDSGANQETAVVASITEVGGDATITVAAPLTHAHAAGAQVSGTGITLTLALTRRMPAARRSPTSSHARCAQPLSQEISLMSEVLYKQRTRNSRLFCQRSQRHA